MPGPTAVPIQFALVNAANISVDEETAINNAFDVLNQLRISVTRPGAAGPFIDTITSVDPGQDSYEVEISVPLEETSVEVQVELIGSVGSIELFSAVVEVTIRGTSADTTSADSTATDSGSTSGAVVITLPIRYTGPGLRGLVLDPDGAPAQGLEVDLFKGEELFSTAMTGVNGEYLFTNLEPIAYVVRVRTDGSTVSCPPERDIAPVSELSRVVGGFKLSRTDCRLNVLVLSGGDVDNNGSVIGGLAGSIPEASFSSQFVVVRPPSLSSLLQYDAVLLYENGTYEHANQVGDRIAQYIAAGGNVIIGSFYWQNHSDSGFGHTGWGSLEGLDVFSSTGGAVYGPASLGSVTPHPITEGVSEITVDRWWGGVSGGGTVVASWADGTPLAGFAIGSGGQRIVAISSFPGAMSGDLSRLWANAVRWAAGAGGPTKAADVGGG